MPRYTVHHAGQPALVIDRPVTKHLKVLGGMTLRCVGVICGIQQAHAIHRQLRDAVDRVGHRQARCFQHRGADVVHVRPLATHLAT